jgi:archaellum biogenesis ATPase FlaH
MIFDRVTVPIPENYVPPKQVKKVAPEPVKSSTNNSYSDYTHTHRIGEIKLQTAIKSVLATNDNKWTNLRKHSFTLGGYVAAGLLSEYMAYEKLVEAINQKDCADYTHAHKTIKDALEAGMKIPFDKEATIKEREQWLEENFKKWSSPSESSQDKGESANENPTHETEERNFFCSTGEDILSRGIQEIPTLIDPIFPQVGLVALAGSSDTGKSSWLRQFAIAVSLGDEYFLGWKLNLKHKGAIYVSTEDDELAINYLLNKQTKTRNLVPSNYRNLRFLFDTTNLLDKLDKELSRTPADCVIIDAFTDLYSGSLNQTNEVRTFLNKYKLLSDKHKCLIVFLHHTGKKTEEKEPSKHNLLGSQGFEAKMRLVIELRTDSQQDDIRHLCLVKGNYLSREFKQSSFVLRFDENMLFHQTDERTPFEDLIKADTEREAPEDERISKILKAVEMKNNGFLQDKIAEELGVTKSCVSKWLKKHSP